MQQSEARIDYVQHHLLESRSQAVLVNLYIAVIIENFSVATTQVCSPALRNRTKLLLFQCSLYQKCG